MTQSGSGLDTDTAILSLDNLMKEHAGFVKLTPVEEAHNGQFAKSLASAYIRITEEGQNLSSQESVQSFIALADLHRQLSEEARTFLQDEVAFIYEDQQIHPILVDFAAWRLKQASRRLYFASLQNEPVEVMNRLKQAVRQHQLEVDALLQTV